MKVKINKILTMILIAILVITPISAFANTNKKPIDVNFNKTNIKLNGVTFIGNKMVYNKTVYLSIKNIANLFDISIYYYKPTNTTYIGQVPAGEVPKDIIKSWENTKQPDKIVKEGLISKELSKINVDFNSGNIKVHGEKIKSDNILYNNDVFVSLQEVCNILDINYNYYELTSTYYVGMIPQNEVPYDVYKKWFSDKKIVLNSEPASGEMAGWQKLIGHDYKSIADIYYKLEGTILSVCVIDIRKVDLNQTIAWTDDEGRKMHSTVKNLYKLFSTFSKYTTEELYNKFGNLYSEWLMVSSIKAESIVSDYLEETGQIEKQNNITLTPDAEYEIIEAKKEDNVSAEQAIKRIEEYMKKQNNK